MSGQDNLETVLEFLKGLQKNNNKAWFEQHRAAYEAAKGAFEEFVDELILGLGQMEDLRGVTAKDSVMRIYRDVRFSKDKSPYKTAMSASIGPGGKKSRQLKYFLHIEPHDASMIAGGLHMPESAQINQFRAVIARDARKFKQIVSAQDFKHFFGAVEGEKLKTAPQGFAREHAEIELLRLKEVVAIHRIPDRDVLSPRFREHTLKAFAAMKPFLDYLNSVAM